MEKKDYSYRVWLLVFAIILSMGGLSFVPSFKVFGLTTKKMDILSELRDKSEVSDESSTVDYSADFATLDAELAEAQSEPADSLQNVAPIRYEWIIAADSIPQRREIFSEHIKLETTKHQVPIEDFDTTGVSRLDRFINKLIDGDDVRVAFLGDSFIEGDIITVDMREQLQQMFGGRGVGFVPCELPFAIFRTSVKRSASGWSSYSLLNPGSIPEAYRNRFFMSGYLSSGQRGATVRWQTTDVKPRLDSCSRARILVSCRDTSSVELTVNDTLKHNIGISGADYVRELYVEAPISSIKMRVLSGNVICHGVSLEGDRGVMVDNLSIRGNSGHTIFGSSIATNTQIDKMLGYDLVVLEYGLNAMQPGQRNFSRYQQKLGDMIRYCQRCFPDAAILVLGVSDRAIKGDGGWKSINSVGYLGPVQRAAAKTNGACFWDLGRVVMSYGGINGFVKNGWAAGDHIHINFKGGARIAESLVQAIQQRAYDMLLKREGKDKDLVCPINLQPWKAYKDGVTEADLCITPLIFQPGAEAVPVVKAEAKSEVEPVEEKTESEKEAEKEEKAEESEKKSEESKEEKAEESKEEKKSEPEEKVEPKEEKTTEPEKKAEEPKKEEPKAEPVKAEVKPVEQKVEPKTEPVAPKTEKPATPKAETPKAEPAAPKAEQAVTSAEPKKEEQPVEPDNRERQRKERQKRRDAKKKANESNPEKSAE
ncbi:MAG: hypothetical protein IKL20_03315 [Alistipes sp.]|nr:hypothetical protein [Alistipes sp.]